MKSYKILISGIDLLGLNVPGKHFEVTEDAKEFLLHYIGTEDFTRISKFGKNDGFVSSRKYTLFTT